ncbi:MAG: histidine kinase [Flavobacteriales bacterium]|nr:histidine kinase [Flavobacteriales bacterium]
MRSNRRTYYWQSQLAGWTIYSLMLTVWNYINIGFDLTLALKLFFLIIGLGIGLSHLFRLLILSRSWLKMRLGAIIPRVILGSLVFGIIYSLLLASILDLFFPNVGPLLTGDLTNILTLFVTFTILFLLWSTGYFAYHYLRNYELEEIKNLRLEASQRDLELANLKSQLNPHFIFNAMNSIRALVDEDPGLAKSAVTKLSNILRNSLTSGRKNLVTIQEELNLVKDHLDLEQIRYEERLKVNYDIDKSLLDLKIPPMMIQLMVENAIKHGIARLQEGGQLSIRIQAKGKKAMVSVVNTGRLENHRSQTGIGLENLKRRLNILYKEKASFQIAEQDDRTVKATITLPKTHTI